ncbi:neuromedin-S isoform X2 [Heterocephalus glaber]|uniref:Neuromedin-S n=1 Tax=Heterocephalus glaber TaxID=10181 RepID=A0AAX6T1A1_HETGA|nr:neuromedin-S isoform X2 [Heterocephalus glaber]
MKHLPQLPSVLAMYCFCMIQIRSSGFPQPLAHPPDGLDIVELKLTYCLNKWAMLSNQPKDNHDIHKRFLFHYSRTQEPTYSVKTRFPPVHSLMHLAAKLASRKMKRFPQHRDSGPAAVDLNKKDPTATLGQPFFLFRPRNGRNTEVQDQQSVQGSNGKGKLDPRRLCSDYFEQMSSFFL